MSVAYALLPSVVRFTLHSFLEIDATESSQVSGGEDWLPAAANINALPEGVRRYVHALQTVGARAHDSFKKPPFGPMGRRFAMFEIAAIALSVV
jgi:hypothetical protein